MNHSAASRSVFERFQDLKPDPSWAFWHLKPSDTNYATHGYHRYPAKFIPQLAERLILNYSEKGEWVIDPFMGSGTTLVEAKKLQRPTLGTDINPVAHLVTQAKITPLPPEELRRRTAHLWERIFSTTSSRDGVESDPTQIHERLQHWFAPETLTKLWAIHQAIEAEAEESYRTFFRCAFSHILKPCSYWSNRSVKPLRQLNKSVIDPLNALQSHLQRMTRGNRAYHFFLEQSGALQTPALAYCADARELPVPSNHAALIVTSPPYVTSYEYADLHQLTALWYRYASDLKAFRSHFIGTASVNGKAIRTGSRLADETVEMLALCNQKKAQEVAVYFTEMRQCFKEMHRVLRPGGRACIVIGNTSLEKVPILNAQVFAEQMADLEMELEQVILREIPSKMLPTTRDSKTGKFAKVAHADAHAYPQEYILVFRKRSVMQKSQAGCDDE